MGMLGYGSLDRRFFHALGATSSTAPSARRRGRPGYKATVGTTIGFDPEAIVHARLIVAWGANIVSSNMHLWPFVRRRAGAGRGS